MAMGRLIPLLLMDSQQRLVKTVGFDGRTYVGDPFNVVRLFNEKEVDELCLLDIDATTQNRGPNFDCLRRLASECFMPLAYGGGITTPEQCQQLGALGIEKFVIGTGINSPGLLRAISTTFGTQALVVSVDVREGRCFVASGSKPVNMSPADLAKRAVESGAGEILLQSIERDGCRSGMDLELISHVASRIEVPVVAVGGAGNVDHLEAALRAGASAAASGSAFTFIGRLRAVLISYPSAVEP